MIALENILSQEIIQKLGWTLLHFIWQAAVVALLLAILLRVLRKSTANLRYIIASLALALIVLLPVITIKLVPVSVPQKAIHIEPAPAPIVLPTLEMPAAETIIVEEPVQHESVTPISADPWTQRAIGALEPALPYIVSGWLIGVFGLSLWHLGGWTQLQRLKRRMVKQVDGTLHSKLKVLAQRLRVKQTVQLMESALVQIPTVVGWLRPVILLPATALTGLSSEQLEAILAHELAHIKRYDYLVNMLQTIVEILGFYHPAVWWVSHKIRTERENCCDDLAVSISGDRVCYAGALTSMEEIRAGRGKLAVAATGGNLSRRICRLVGKDSAEKTGFSWIPAATAILLIATLVIPTALALTIKSDSLQPELKTDVQVEVRQKQLSIVSGRCTDANGHPVSNAQVSIFEQDYKTRSLTLLAESRTDAEGHFSLGPVAPLGEDDHGRKTYIIFVPANGHGPAWKRIAGIRPNMVGLELVAYESGVLMGNVLTENSKPVVGANVWIRQIIPPEGTEDPKSRRNDLFSITPLPGWSAITDRNGSFRITGVPEGARIQLVISHGDFAELWAYVRTGKSVDIKVLPAAVITGRVVHEKTNLPAVGVRVEAQGIDQHAFVQTVTDEQGRYRLESLAADKYNVWAEAEGLTVVALDSFEVEVGQTREAPDLRLVEGGFIVGKVIDEKTGNPIKPGTAADVAIHGPSRPQSGAAVESSRIREDGSFRIRVAPGRNYIHLRPREGWRRQQAVVTPGRHWVTAKNGQMVEVEFKIRKLSEDEIEKAKADRGRTIIKYGLPKTIDELKEQEIEPDVQVEVQKEESADKLKQLGLAVAMYADDHDENLPDSLQKLKPYIRDEQDFNWLLENIMYFGSGKSALRNTAKIPIAYDKNLFKETDGTNVLFLDFSVRFLETKQLEKLGIRRVEFLIEARFLSVSEDFLENIGLDANSPDEAKALSKLKSEMLAASDGSKTQSLILDERNVSLLLKAVRANKDAKVLTAPQVICEEDKTAEIRVFNNLHFISGYTEPNRPSDKPEPTYDSVKEGTFLSVKPKLTPNKDIDMEFELEITNVLSFEERQYKGKYPYMHLTVQKTTQATRYIAHNGQTLLFGGHKISKRKDDRTEQKDLLVLIKAQTVDSPEQDRSVQAKDLILAEPGKTTSDVIVQTGIAKSRIITPYENEREKTRVATAVTKPDESVEPNEPMESVNLKNAEMITIIEKLSEWTGKVIIPTAELLKQKITIYAPEKLPRSKAIAVIYSALRVIGYTAEQTDEVIIIKPVKEARPGEVPTISDDEPFTMIKNKDQVVQKLFKLKHHNSSQMAQIVRPLLGHTGHVSADERTNNLLVIDTVENLKRIELIIAEFDVAKVEQTVTEIFEIRYGDPAEIVQLLRTLISGQPGFGAIIEPGKQPVVLIPEPRRKWIIAKASAEDMKLIGEWIARLDREEAAKAEHETVLIKYANVGEVASRLNEALQKMPGSELQTGVLIQPLEKARQIVIFGKADKREMVKKLIAEIDIPSGEFETRTFKLKYADPNQIKENIDNLYGGTAPSGSARYYYYRYGRGSRPSDADTVKVISYPKLKQVTVIASPDNMLKISEQIEEWDVPLDVDKLKPRIIELKNSDAAQMAKLLRTLFAEEGGGGLNIQDILIDRGTELKQKIVGPPYEQLTFEEVPGTNKLIVISKIPEAYDVIEEFIFDLDRQEMTPEDMKQIGEWKKKLGRKEPAPTSLEQIEQQIIKQQKILKMRQDCINNDPVVKALSENVANAEKELIVARQKFTQLHPQVLQKAELLQLLKKRLDERITALGKSFDDMMWPEPNLPPAPEVPLITNTWLQSDMLEVLHDIASMAGIPIIPDETVVGLITAELKDVPLDTALDIVLAGTPYVVKKTPYYYLIASELEPPEIQKRVYSAKKLSNLGKALLIYANDHEDKYPDSLHHLSEYLNVEDLKRVLANIKYLAQGKTPAVRPDTIIAYDKKLLAEGKGTNVLYNDSHVEFVKPERLKELGISATAILISTQLLSVSEDFLKDIGLDANSISSSDAWSEHLVADSAAEPNSETYSLILDDLHVSFLLKATQAHKDARMLTAPRATVHEGKTAEIAILTEEYYVLGYTEPNRPSDEPETKLDKVEIGTRIWLKPELTPDKKNVRLDFKLEIRQLLGYEERKYKGKYKYIVPRTEVVSTQTQLLVPDGKTLLIGGLKMTEQEKEPRAPRLKDLPLIGGLFSSNNKIKDHKMLLILVKPIITPQQKARKILRGQEDSEEHIKSLARQLEKKLNPPAD